MIDGGPGADPPGQLDAWLVTDERAELIAAIRRLAAKKGLVRYAGSFREPAPPKCPSSTRRRIV